MCIENSVSFFCTDNKVISVDKKTVILSFAPATECFLCTGNIMFSMQKKKTLFSMYKKHFFVCEKERNNVLYAQETLYCLGKPNKHCSLCTRNTFLSMQMKETLFSV